MSSMISLKTPEGQSFQAYFAPAQAVDAPGIVLIQEIFGINDSMRTLADEWSAKGFNVVVPDLFWRQEPGVQLEPRVESEFARGVELMQAVDQEVATQDLEVARAWLAEKVGHDRIGAMGYCFGGRMVVKLAAANRIRCAVSFYGVGLEQFVPELGSDTAPTQLHIAELDDYVPADVRQLLLTQAEQRQHWEAYVYEGCDHAFARPNGEHWVADAAKQANDRAQKYLNQFLQA